MALVGAGWLVGWFVVVTVFFFCGCGIYTNTKEVYILEVLGGPVLF